MQAIKLIQLGYGKVGKAFEAVVKDREEVEYLEIIRSRNSPQNFNSASKSRIFVRDDKRLFLVDVTASTDTTGHLLEARRAGWGLLLANKNPLVENQSVFDELMNGAIGFSATVGAGLPVIPEIRRLLQEGHRIVRLEACLSGSMGVLASELEKGHSFSATIHEAIEQGFTEPDPRIDLAGLDVAKKMLILTRMAGYQLEYDQIERQSLFPAPMAEIELGEFVQQLCLLDPVMDRRVQNTRMKNQVLRFVATMDEGQCSVGFKDVAKDSPLGQLTADQKRILIFTDQQHEPIIITGAGSGPADTAKDLLKDLLYMIKND